MAYQSEFLELAIRLAKENVDNGLGGPFGAVVVREGVVIATGANSVTRLVDPTAHAEVTAIRNACEKLKAYQLENCEIYSSCEPCPMCLGAIYWSRPKALYFAADKHDAANAGFDDSFIYNEIKLDFINRHITTQHIPHKNRLIPFKAWDISDLKLQY